MEFDNKYDPTIEVGKLKIERKVLYTHHYDDPNKFQMALDLLDAGYTMEEVLNEIDGYIILEKLEEGDVTYMIHTIEEKEGDKKIKRRIKHGNAGKISS